ncbi:MAG: hypothetical protein J6C11_09670 [Spirochaetaceae bacterium]|nr:hypothetical protein [Spirochaetaceae bacterium]
MRRIPQDWSFIPPPLTPVYGRHVSDGGAGSLPGKKVRRRFFSSALNHSDSFLFSFFGCGRGALRALAVALLLAAASPRAWAMGASEVPAATEAAVPVPIIRLPEAVDQLHWSYDGSLFGYAEGNAVVVRDAATYAVRDVVRPSQNEVRGFVFSELLGSRQGVLSMASDSSLSVSGLEMDSGGTVVLPPVEREDEEGGRLVTALNFDDRSGYVAIGSSDGYLELALYLQYIQNLSRYELRGHESAVRLVRFSTDSQWLASLSEDGALRVWDVRGHRLVGQLEWQPPVELEGMSVTAPFAVFGREMPKMLLPVDSCSLEVRDMAGAVLVSLSVPEGIRGLRVNVEGDRLEVLTETNHLYRYDLETGRFLGHIPLLFNSDVVSFAVNRSESRILVSYGDGSLVMMEMAEVFVPADGEDGAYQLILINPDGTQRRLLTLEDLRGAGIDPDEALMNSYRAGPSVAGEPFHSVDLLAGTTFLPDPFVMSVDAQLGYVNGFLLHPLYFGVQWRSSWGFPRRDFPYIYNGGEFASPLLIDWVVEVPLGLRFVPWEFGLEIYTEVALGFAMHELWNRELGARAVTAGLNSGHFHGAVVTAVTLGVGWRGVLLKASGEWDSELGWTGQLSLGYSFRLPVPRRWSGGGGSGRRGESLGYGVFARSAGPDMDVEPGVEAESAEMPENGVEIESTADVEPESVEIESAETAESVAEVGPAMDGEAEETDLDAETAGLKAGGEGMIDYERQAVLD